MKIDNFHVKSTIFNQNRGFSIHLRWLSILTHSEISNLMSRWSKSSNQIQLFDWNFGAEAPKKLRKNSTLSQRLWTTLPEAWKTMKKGAELGQIQPNPKNQLSGENGQSRIPKSKKGPKVRKYQKPMKIGQSEVQNRSILIGSRSPDPSSRLPWIKMRLRNPESQGPKMSEKGPKIDEI